MKTNFQARVRPIKRYLRQKYKRWQFLRSLRPNDVFIVSYPRSGTTWFGYILANLIKPASVEVKIPNQYAPDVNAIYSKGGSMQPWKHLPSPRFLRLHATYDPALPKVVYILRHLWDVMVSCYHYQCLQKPNPKRSQLDFITSDDHWPCTWDEHVSCLWLVA